MSESPFVPLLLVPEGGESDFRYATGFHVEQSLYLRLAEDDDLLVTPGLELERARLQSSARRIVDRAELGWQEVADPRAGWAGLAARELTGRRIERVRVAPTLPIAYYRALRAVGIDGIVDDDLFVAERRHKTPEQASFIHSAQRAAEAACREVIGQLAAAEVRDGLLWIGERELTSEWLMARAQLTLSEIGYASGEMIIAGSPGCALPHFQGSGQVRAHAPVIIDIFPRGATTGYHGDLTRTVVVGEVPAEVGAMFEACVAAIDAGEATIRAGVNGREVHHAVCRTLVEHGFGTTTPGFEAPPGRPRMNHSTGHGVGLDIHEAPQLRDLDYPLQAGDVVTVEPGLYLEGLGGIRVEDTGMVTSSGFRNFTSLPRSLDPADYL